MAISDSLLSFVNADPSSSSSLASDDAAHARRTIPTTTTQLPPGASILLTDSLAVSAQPWLVHFVSRALRPPPPSLHQQQQQPGGPARVTRPQAARDAGAGGSGGKRKVIVLGVREREEWWTGVLKKSGIQLATEKTSNHFNYFSLSDDPATPLVESFARIRETISSSTTAAVTVDPDSDNAEVGPLVVLDDVSALGWMGHDLRDVLRFWNGLRSLLEPSRATLVTLQHYAPAPASGIEEDPVDTYLFRALLQRSDLWLQVEPLGGASSTSGEISVHLAPAYLPIPPFAIDPSCGALNASGPLARPFWVDEGAGGVEIGVKGRERIGGGGGASKWA
ncbi:hypothetical protein JCM8115_002689 [Rhodotorula mucilaginosa]